MSVIWTKKAGLITLPELSNPGTSNDLAVGKELIDEMGNVVIGRASNTSVINTIPLRIAKNNVPGAISFIAYTDITDGQVNSKYIAGVDESYENMIITENAIIGSIIYIAYNSSLYKLFTSSGGTKTIYQAPTGTNGYGVYSVAVPDYNATIIDILIANKS